MKGGTGFGMVPTHVRGFLTAIELAVYVALSWRVGKDGSLWPSHATIAEEAGTSVKSVKRALDSLRAKGLVTWEPRVDPNHGGPTSNRYWIAIQAPRSERPTPQVPLTYELDPDEPNSFIAASQDRSFGSTAMQTSSGPREREPIDLERLIWELDADDEACGFMANNNWLGGTEELVEAALAGLREKPAINDEGAWLGAALQHMSPVRKAARLLELVGADDE